MKAGIPVARLVPVEKAPHAGNWGGRAGEFVVPEDFDAPLPVDREEDFLSMKYLLDTHTFLWAASDPARLSPKAAEACATGQLG
jgi:hypothetical protein